MKASSENKPVKSPLWERRWPCSPNRTWQRARRSARRLIQCFSRVMKPGEYLFNNSRKITMEAKWTYSPVEPLIYLFFRHKDLSPKIIHVFLPWLCFIVPRGGGEKAFGADYPAARHGIFSPHLKPHLLVAADQIYTNQSTSPWSLKANKYVWLLFCFFTDWQSHTEKPSGWSRECVTWWPGGIFR